MLLLTTPAGARESKPWRALEFGHLARVYYSFEHIRPVVSNTGDRAVYLSSFHPQAAARLMRFNEGTGEWEYGEWARQCASVPNVGKPIEVLPGGSYWPAVFWQYSMDDWDKPTAFETADDERRPLAGRYKLSLSYALRPWVLGGSPGPIFSVKSEEFTVEP
jgi:hypothetical protein